MQICGEMGPRKTPWFIIFSVLFLCFSLNTHLCIGVSIISAGESISGDQTLISQGEGNFKLGFFTTGNNSQNYYIGIWYSKIPGPTVVWVANRDKPLSDKYSSELKLLEDGNLVLFNSSKTPIWSTNLNFSTSNSTEAVLLDSGNFVLRNRSEGLNSSAFHWESFDHPTDTWLPGGKLGLNKLTNKSTLLTSWINKEDPAPGIFSLELDPAGTSQYYILRNMSQNYWTSGTWNGQIFRLVPEMRINYIYNFTYVSNEKENYFYYTVYNTSIISRFVMGLSGQIQQLSWYEDIGWNLFWSQPRQQCEVPDLCGAFGTCTEKALPFCGCLPGFDPRNTRDYWNLSDWSGGCKRRNPLQCMNTASVNGQKDGFLLMPNMKLPKNAQSLASGSAEACSSACLTDCSCTAYVYGSGGCSVWNGDLLNLQQLSDGDTGGGNLYLKLAAPDLPKSGGKKGKITGAIVGAVAGVVALLGIVVVLLWCWRRRLAGPPKAVEGSLIAFGYRDLQSATKNFSEKLGGGGFGSVFKGTLPDSTVIAVKKLEGFNQGEKQFRTEVSTIGTIQHVNLVRLRGFCSEGTKRLLVYDYMPKGSLDFLFFHDKKELEILDWKTRYQIALGTARGLAYLHEKCRDCIIHCDVKPENILLDAEFCPKVADFGLAKLMGREFSRVLTTMRGTRGYLAPEWISGVAITPKADVYSYGMMLFEIISGRRNSEQSEDGKVAFFPTWAASQIIGGGEILALLDYRLEGNADIEEFTRACRVACWCIQDDEVHRPSMGQVVQILEGVQEVTLPPIPRSLRVLAEDHEQMVFFYESSSNQSSQAQTNSSNANSQARSTMSSKSSMSGR